MYTELTNQQLPGAMLRLVNQMRLTKGPGPLGSAPVGNQNWFSQERVKMVWGWKKEVLGSRTEKCRIVKVKMFKHPLSKCFRKNGY